MAPSSLQTDDPAARTWLQDQLDSLVTHRLAQPAAVTSADAHKPRLRFAESADDHPLGRLLAVEGDPMGSSYRIKDQPDHRRQSPDRQTKHDDHRAGQSTRTADGRFLPHSYVVNYWDAATGKLNRVETFQERWRRIGSWDLPAMRSILTTSDAGLSVKVVEFSKHALLGSK